MRPGLLKIVDTIDVFSTKYEKVVKHGVEDSSTLSPLAEAELLNRADLFSAQISLEALEVKLCRTIHT